jgi:hypothetical protein
MYINNIKPPHKAGEYQNNPLKNAFVYVYINIYIYIYIYICIHSSESYSEILLYSVRGSCDSLLLAGQACAKNFFNSQS